MRRKLAGSDDGDRQMVKILAAVLTDGLAAVERGGKMSPGAVRRASIPLTSSSTSSRASARSWTSGDNHDARRFAAPPRTDRRLRPLRSTQERLTHGDEPKSST